MNIRKFYIGTSVIGLTLIIHACTLKTSEKHSEELGQTSELVHFNELVDSVILTRVQEDETTILGTISKIEVGNRDFYALNQQHNMIVRIDSLGICQSKLKKIGKSRTEYIRIEDFSIDNEKDVLAILCDFTKVIYYDLNFNLLKVENINVPLYRVCLWEGKLYGYTAEDNCIVRIENGVVQKIIETDQVPFWVFSQTPVFHKTGNKLLATLECDNKIYEIRHGEAKELLTYTYENDEEIRRKYMNPPQNQTTTSLYEETPLKIQHLAIRNNQLLMIYSKDMLVRIAEFDLKNKSIVRDGVFHGSPSPSWNALNVSLASSFETESALPVDSSYLDKIVEQNKYQDEGPVIIKYVIR